ncbi:MAG: hypothetical protein NZ699_11740 [Roseiflexus sp.]|nr:hypothetical protein [Roseiflexus sp.]MCS7289793.1 hypothetical protein [Roseiflexus sp.]MDW8145724.1 hypothetical protein [Roseiflexaceae bacterium]MDW8232492.1 hypothetical protein [Roseiflexaceae bacterium]
MAVTVHNSSSRHSAGIASGRSVESLVISVYVCALTLTIFMALSDQFWHWFIVPVVMSGILIGIDAVDWVRGRVDLFDPIGLSGAFGWFFFFLAPLLTVATGYWLIYVEPPAERREWLGWMALLNLLGLIVYRGVRLVYAQRERRITTFWDIDRKRFYFLGAVALVVTALIQSYVYLSMGGIQGFIEEATDQRAILLSLRGYGQIFMISESFPIIAFMMFVLYARDHKSPIYRSWLILGIVLLIYFALKIYFGGLRGSRNNTIWGLFWAVGLIHFWIRPITRKVVLIGLGFLITFMYVYGFYKNAGLEVMRLLEDPTARVELERETRRDFTTLLLGDLGRSDVQAFLLYRLARPDSDYEYALGRTYVAAFAVLIPRSVIERMPSKTLEGTEALHGRGSYIPIDFEATQLYGLAGEAMLNFGIVAAPVSFIAFGLANCSVRRWLFGLKPGDARLLFYPFLALFCFYMLACDLENIVFDVIKNITVPLGITVLSLSSVSRLPASEQ